MSIFKIGLLGKSPPGKIKDIMNYLTRSKVKNTDLPDVFPASQAPIPAKSEFVETKDAVNRFVRDNPRTEKAGGGMLVQPSADGLRPGYAKNKGTTKSFYDESTGHIHPRKNRFGTVYSDTPAGGNRRNVIPKNIGKKILKEYKDGAGTIELGDKYGFSKDTINRYIKKFNPKLLRDSPPKVNQYNFNYSIIDKIKEDAKTMSRKEILKKYEGKISTKKLDSLNLTFGIVEESGRPRIPEGERSPKQVKRVNRIRNAQGFDVSGTFAKNFHHIFPIGGLSKLSAQDVMILDKKFNETLGGFNLQLNDIADEIATMDLSDPNALKKLNDLNAKSKDLVNRAKTKLPKELQNAIGYIEYNPVFDENGTIFELSQVRKGVDAPMGSLPAEFGTKKFKDYTPEEIKKFKNRVKQLAIQAGDEGAMFAANPFFNPGILKEAFKQLPTPAGAVALNLGFGVDPTSAIDRAGIAAEAAFAPALVKQAAKLGSVGQRIANLGLSPTMAMRIARVASPLGIASLGLEGAYQYGKFVKDELDRIKQMTPEEREAYNIEQQEQMGVSAAEGGLIRLIGKKSGPPPESGPMSQGLQGLMKRGIKG